MLRCPWAKSEIAIEYHDHEWGVPVHDDHKLFEFLILEGAQAGLNLGNHSEEKRSLSGSFRRI